MNFPKSCQPFSLQNVIVFVSHYFLNWDDSGGNWAHYFTLDKASGSIANFNANSDAIFNGNLSIFTETRDFVNIEEWLDIWAELLHNSRDLNSLPLWLQYFPKILFQVINKTGKLRKAYTKLLQDRAEGEIF